MGIDYRLVTNLKCYCRTHHLVKTFWDWHEQQLPDATLILTSPAGQTYVTTPGSALLFPTLCTPTADLPPHRSTATNPCAERTAMMPRRRRTRAQHRTQRITTERRHNRMARTTPKTTPQTAAADEEPPPF